jgi:hypothetical protein
MQKTSDMYRGDIEPEMVEALNTRGSYMIEWSLEWSQWLASLRSMYALYHHIMHYKVYEMAGP